MGRIIRDTGRNCGNLFGMELGSKRRSLCNSEVEFWSKRVKKKDSGELGIIESFSPPLPDSTLGNVELDRKQCMEMLRRSKLLLAMRKPSLDLIEHLDRRRVWNISNRLIENNLDLFPSVKYSHSSALPCNRGRISLVVSDKGKARFVGVARSNNIRLDPVDAQKVIYKRRLEIQRALVWGYDNGFIPVMMTLTIFHDWTWQPLTKLIAVLRKSYEDLFGHKIGGKLKKAIGFQYRIFRMEETLDKENGWHPHYHIVLFVPKDNLRILSDLEPTLKDRWSRLVQKHYRNFVGDEVPESYLSALYERGLYLSRYSKGKFKGQLYQVDNSKYLAKIMGCDFAEVYGGDKEVTNVLQKNSMIPFDLLRGSVTAEKVDLWNEYAIATKGLSCFRFTSGFKAIINEYFECNPHRDPVAKISSEDVVVATMKEEVYHLLYRNFKLDELKEKVSEGYDALRDWLRELFIGWGLLDWFDCSLILSRPSC